MHFQKEFLKLILKIDLKNAFIKCVFLDAFFSYRYFLYSKTVESSEDKSFRQFYYTRITGK